MKLPILSIISTLILTATALPTPTTTTTISSIPKEGFPTTAVLYNNLVETEGIHPPRRILIWHRPIPIWHRPSPVSTRTSEVQIPPPTAVAKPKYHTYTWVGNNALPSAFDPSWNFTIPNPSGTLGVQDKELTPTTTHHQIDSPRFYTRPYTKSSTSLPSNTTITNTTHTSPTSPPLVFFTPILNLTLPIIIPTSPQTPPSTHPTIPIPIDIPTTNPWTHHHTRRSPIHVTHTFPPLPALSNTMGPTFLAECAAPSCQPPMPFPPGHPIPDAIPTIPNPHGAPPFITHGPLPLPAPTRHITRPVTPCTTTLTRLAALNMEPKKAESTVTVTRTMRVDCQGCVLQVEWMREGPGPVVFGSKAQGSGEGGKTKTVLEEVPRCSPTVM